MTKFTEHIEKTFAGMPQNKLLFRYQRQLLDKMNERACEVTRSGLKDENVLTDLIISEFPDLREDYRKFAIEERKKSKERLFRKFTMIGSAIFIPALIFLYLGVSFLTDNWAKTWLIVLGGISALVIFIFSALIMKLGKMKWMIRPIARVLLAFNIMLTATNVFLWCLLLFEMPKSWLIYLGAVVVLFIADALFAAFTRQRMAIINYLLYIPAAMSMVYVILGELGVVAWNTGWLIIMLGVLIDFAILAGIMINNSRYIYRQEVEDVWSEN